MNLKPNLRKKRVEYILRKSNCNFLKIKCRCKISLEYTSISHNAGMHEKKLCVNY